LDLERSRVFCRRSLFGFRWALELSAFDLPAFKLREALRNGAIAFLARTKSSWHRGTDERANVVGPYGTAMEAPRVLSADGPCCVVALVDD
jgi:hypothetical protein